MEKRLERVLEKVAESMQRLPFRLADYTQTRRGIMVSRALFGFAAVVVTLYIVRHEFPELFIDADFIALLTIWGLYGLYLFWTEYRQLKEGITAKKIDDLINEIREDRKQRSNELQELINEIRQDRNERKNKDKK